VVTRRRAPGGGGTRFVFSMVTLNPNGSSSSPCSVCAVASVCRVNECGRVGSQQQDTSGLAGTALAVHFLDNIHAIKEIPFRDNTTDGGCVVVCAVNFCCISAGSNGERGDSSAPCAPP
ncbi:unnamed protein product, partial [Ectocarpus sp. 8 AP-2014]